MRVAGRALDLAPPPRTRVGLWVMDGAIALARGDNATAVKRANAARQVLAPGGFDEQHHLPLAWLDTEIALAAEGPAAAVAVAADALARTTCRCAAPGTRGPCW